MGSWYFLEINFDSSHIRHRVLEGKNLASVLRKVLN